MRALFDGAQAGWNEGQFGKIAVESNTTLAFDSTGQAAMVASGNAVHLKGTVTPQGGVQGSEPNQMTVLLAGSKIGTFQVTATPFSFDIPLPTLPAVANQKSTEVLMVAWRGDPNPGPTTPVGNNTRAIYGTFRRFEISVAPITTVAGTGVYGFNGLAGRAIDVQLSQPIGVAVDTTGNLYIGDYGNHLVRKVDALTGSLTTVSGSGRVGIGGVASVEDAVNMRARHPTWRAERLACKRQKVGHTADGSDGVLAGIGCLGRRSRAGGALTVRRRRCR